MRKTINKIFFCLLLTVFIISAPIERSFGSQQREDAGSQWQQFKDFFRSLYNAQDYLLKPQTISSREKEAKTYAHYMLGVIFENQRMFPEALKEFEKAQGFSPESDGILLKRALVYVQLKEYDNAQECIKTALAHDDKNQQARFMMGMLYVRKGEYAKACAEYEKLCEQAPDNVIAQIALAEVYTFGRRFSEASSIYRKLLATKGLAPQYLYFKLGELYIGLNNEKAAAENFRHALSLEPSYAEAVIGLGALEEIKGNRSEAIDYYKRAYELSPLNHNIALRIARLCFLAKDYQSAQGWYQKVIENNPVDTEAYLGLADIYLLIGDQEKAIRILNEALEVDAKEPYALLLLGAVYSERKDYKKAQGFLRRCISQDPDYAEAYFYLGSVLERAGERQKAKESLKKAIELSPEHDQALNYLGYMYAEDNENLDEAISLIGRALKVDPQNGAYIDSLSWAYYKKGDIKKAKELIEQAVRLYGDDAVIYDHMGDIYKGIGDEKRAIQAWKRSLNADPTQENVKRKIIR